MRFRGIEGGLLLINARSVVTMGSRIRELELQVAYLRGYSKISESDFEIACERYGMGKVN